jgi:hypothetical protein
VVAQRRLGRLGRRTDVTTPTAVAGINSPLHVLVLVGMGMPLIEDLDLEEFVKQAAAHQRWTFLFVLAPLNVRGATGSAVNPIGVPSTPCSVRRARSARPPPAWPIGPVFPAAG